MLKELATFLLMNLKFTSKIQFPFTQNNKI